MRRTPIPLQYSRYRPRPQAPTVASPSNENARGTKGDAPSLKQPPTSGCSSLNPMNKPIIITLTNCNCPAGAWNARINRHAITAYHDDPATAAAEAVRTLGLRQGEQRHLEATLDEIEAGA